MNKLLRLHSDWGLSDKPGSKEMIIDEDGSYTIKMDLLIMAERKTENKSDTGKIPASRMKEIIDFLKENITEDVSRMMFDASETIEYTNEGRTYKVMNYPSIWDKLIALIPEYSKFEI